MPRIPEYGESRVSSSAPGVAAPASPRSIAGPRPTQNYLPSDSFGVADLNPGAEGQAMRGFAQDMGVLAAGLDRLSERMDTAAAEEALVNFEREKNNRFFNPDNGYFNSQGRDAFERAKPTLDELNELRRTIGGGLTSSRARQLFDRAAEQHLLRAETDISRYASAQARAYEQSVINARVEQSLDNAVLYWNDPKNEDGVRPMLAHQLELGEQSLMDLAIMNGESPEVLNEKLQNYRSRFGMATVEAALTEGAVAAQNMLVEHMRLFEPADLLNMQAKIDRQYQAEEEARQSSTALTLASTLVQQYGDAPNARELILEEVRELEQSDPALADKTRREALTRLNQYLEARSEERMAIQRVVERVKMEGGTVDEFIAAEPEAWMKLTPDQQRVLLKPEPVETDLVLYTHMMTLPPTELAKVDPNDYVTRLAPADLQRLTTAVMSARAGDKIELPSVQSLTARTTAAAEQLFGARLTWKMSKAKMAQVQGFFSLVESEVAYRTREKGAALTPTEYNVLLNDVTRQTVVERPWYQRDLVLGLADVEVPEHLVKEGVTPTDYMLQISDLLHQRGLPVTADNILRIHNNQTK